jgi:hypothetical protein
MKKAYFKGNPDGFCGDARLYRLSEAVPYTDLHDNSHTTRYVVVSRVNVPFSGPETYAFPASPDGDVLDWGELPGSTRGPAAHESVLAAMGFKLTEEPDQ